MTTNMTGPLVASPALVPFKESGYGYTVETQGGKWVALCHRQEDAQEIAKRVNAHDGLVKALRSIAADADADASQLQAIAGAALAGAA